MSFFIDLNRRNFVPLLLGFLAYTAIVAGGNPPAWWGDGVVDASNTESDKHQGIANIGQAKWMAKRALETLQAIDPALAADILKKLTTPQPDENAPGQFHPPILDFSVPADPKPADWSDRQRAPLLIGQLKAITAPFYAGLHASYPAWLAAERESNGTNHPNSIFPWTSETSDDANNAVANIGQLKAVFSLRFESIGPIRPDSDGDGLPDDWEIAHGLDPEDASDSLNLFIGSDLTNLQAFNAGVQAHPNATPTNKDGDACVDADDAAPNDPLIDWPRPAHERFVAIEMPESFLSSASNTDFTFLEMTDDSTKVYLSAGGLDGFWELGVEEFVAVAGPSFTYQDSTWGSNRFERSKSLVGMAGTSLLFDAEADAIDDNFGGAVIMPEGGASSSFRVEFLDQGACYRVHAIGGDRSGRAIAFLETMYGRGEDQDPHEVWAMHPNSSNGTIAIASLFSLPSGSAPDFVRITKGGWISAYNKLHTNGAWTSTYNKIFTPAGVELAAPEITGSETPWIEDLPNGRLVVSRQATASRVLLLDAGHEFVRSKSLNGKSIKAATQWGAFLTQENELWTRDRTGETPASSWVPLKDWAGQKIADLVQAGWTLKLSSSNLAGGMVLLLTKEASLPKVFALLPVEVVPDYNRDGKIDQADRGKVTAEKPWRFWVNSDDDSGTEGGDDIPENSTTPDSGNGVVDGVRDLVDFFPLHFDLKAALEVFPETEFQYFLKHESQSPRPGDAHPKWTPSPTFKVVWYPEAELEANTTGENGVGSFLKNLSRAQGIAGRASNTIPKDGIRIPDDMLTAAKSGKGVGLFEARFATDNPIVLEIKKNSGTTLVEVEMPVKISEVESMLRSRFLNENLAGGTQGGVPSEPGNWPDADRNGKHFIFVHGYNVSGEQARGWNSEMFKRMFWSGSDAMFTGVAWHGNESQMGTATPDYWRNVHNAFQTSKSMADFVNALPGGGKCIAAHSLGNIVVSSAIKDHGLSVATYCMVDAAAAIEAYSLASTLGNAEISHPDWRAYDKKLWCSEWHKIFPETDNRHKMTWRDRFGALPNAYNFHSTGEEVLKNGDGTVPGAVGVATSRGLRAWVKQEMSKGFSILSGGGLSHNGTGGWDFNGHWDVAIYSPYGGGGSRRRTPAEAAAIPLADLEEDPFFDPFVNDKFHDPALGSAEAAKYDEVSKALAESLPSLTSAAGSNPIQIFNTRNFDMMSLKNGWPSTRVNIIEGTELTDWRHSDLRNIAYIYTRKVYEKFVELGGLNQ
jgi:hypothetical protein